MNEPLPEDDSEVFVPVGETLGTLEVPRLDEGDVPIAAMVLVRVRQPDGTEAWVTLSTDNIEDYENSLLGLLTVQSEILRHELVNQWKQSDGTS